MEQEAVKEGEQGRETVEGEGVRIRKIDAAGNTSTHPHTGK